MSLENFCEFIIKTKNIEEIKQKLEELDLLLLQSRDNHGNSLLHLAIQANCDVEIFKLILKVSNLSFRNDEFKLPQDLFVSSDNNRYVNEIVNYLVDKLCNCEGEYIRGLVIQGWECRPYLEMAIDKLMDQLNDNFIGFLSSIDSLIELFKTLIDKIVVDNFEEFNNVLTSSQTPMYDVIPFRNQCGLTLLHVALIFERHDVVKLLIQLSEENKSKATDHLGRTILHYLYGFKPSPVRDELIVELSTNSLFNCVDDLGNSPEYYEIFPELFNLDYCIEFIKSDLMNLQVINRKENSVTNKDSDADNDTEYLKKTVGKALVKAFALVVEKRPNDPIDFLGHFLKFYATNFDTSDYEYEVLSSRISLELFPGLERKIIDKSFTFKPEIFSPFAKVARDKHGTLHGYKLLLKKLKSIDVSEVDWFEIIKRGLNFALRDSNENTLLELALSMGFIRIKDDLDSVILNMINEGNLQALKNLFSCGYFENFPDIYELCGPDLFDVSQEVADFYTSLSDEQTNLVTIFSDNSSADTNWCNIITSEMLAYAYNKKGMSVIHWAIASNNNNLFHYIVDYFPDSLKLKDCFNRNVYHYCYAFSNKQFMEIVDEYYPEGKDEIDCFDYLPEYYEFYQSAFRDLK